MNKTIFITSCHPLISRNILSTGIIEKMVQDGTRIVLIVPKAKVDYFFEKNGKTGVVIEGIDLPIGKRESLMKYLSLAALDNKTMHIKRNTEMKGSGKYSRFIFANPIGKSVIRFIENISYQNKVFNELFKKYRPSSVFATDIQSEIDIALLTEAKRKGIKTLAMVRSWDNLTSKGFIRTVPDRLLVWNNVVKDEAIKINGIPEESISVIGIPHYDDYKKYVFADRESFFKKIGADPHKKLVTVIPIGDRYLRSNTVDRDIVDILDKNLPGNYQIMVRMPPGDYVRGIENNKNEFDSKRFLFDRPPQNFENIKQTEFRKDDDEHFANLIHWSDLVVSGPSTAIIDTAFLDRPLVVFAFDGYQKRSYFDSISRYYDYTNFQPVRNSGGAKLVFSIDEFKSAINDYLSNPNKDKEKRRDLAMAEAQYLDGKSTDRLYTELTNSRKRTVFLTIFEGVEAKNLLRTSVVSNILKDPDVSVVLFTKSKEKVEYYKKEFDSPRVSFEIVDYKISTGADRFFSKLKFVLLRTETTDLKRKMVAEYEGNRARYFYGKFVNLLLAWPIVREISRTLDFLFVDDDTYGSYFDKYSPDLVFTAHLFDEAEVSMVREAKWRKVKTVGFINSWDKVTSRCIIRILPDKAIVFNELVKKELVDFDEMKPGDIFVSGLPQYDYYFNEKPEKISSLKKLIVYASMGRSFSSSDWDMIDFLEELVSSGKLVEPAELLVRFQPNDFVDQNEVKKRPNLKYDQPGIRFSSKRGVDWDMDQNDLHHLLNTLYNLDVLVSYASSISIDAAVFDKPVINIDFEIKKENFLLKSPTQYYKSLHYKNILKTGAIDLVKSKEELIESINTNLQNPERKSAERMQMVKEQCAFTDGKSAERIADFVLEYIK